MVRSMLLLGGFASAAATGDASAIGANNKPYTCLNDGNAPVIDTAVGALQTCIGGQKWEPWSCFMSQPSVYLPEAPPELVDPTTGGTPGDVASSLYLAGTRMRLLANNFKGAYDDKFFPGQNRDTETCDYTIRHPKGYCNTEGAQFKEGGAETAFARNTARVDDRGDEMLLTPNPRDVSRSLFTRDEFKSQDFISVLGVGWIQFMTHDWFAHDTDEAEDAIKCPLGFSDHQAEAAGIEEFEMQPTKEAKKANGEFVNTETHWWDSSQLYGKKKDARNLRKRTKGWKYKDGLGNRRECELALKGDGNLPTGRRTGTEKVGFDQNYWSGISVFHNLFSREHNYICEQLKEAYPELDNVQRFNKARLIVSGELAKVHTLDWTPAILANPKADLGMNLNWYGSDAIPDFPIDVPAVKGNPRTPTPDPFAMTEEFVSVYRMHSLLPDYYELRKMADPSTVAEEVPLRNLLAEDVPALNRQYEQSELLMSYGLQHGGQIALNNYPADLQTLRSDPHDEDSDFTDLAMIELLRDRERGLPRYNQFRRGMGMKAIESFEELTSNADEVAKLRDIYKTVDDIDLMVGLHAEECRPTGFVFTESAFQVFILMATARLGADGFFTDKWTPEIYTAWGLGHIESNTFKSILLRHHPELADHVVIPDNAFAPWTVAGN